jgi:rhodanese-related sulfurtransferase
MILLIYPIKSCWRGISKIIKIFQKLNVQKILVYCLSGKRGSVASQVLVDSGYKRVNNIQGGITAWVNAGYPVVVNPNFWTVNYPKVG